MASLAYILFNTSTPKMQLNSLCPHPQQGVVILLNLRVENTFQTAKEFFFTDFGFLPKFNIGDVIIKMFESTKKGLLLQYSVYSISPSC